MCGIFCTLSGANCHETNHNTEILETCLSFIQSRGPDHFQTVACNLPSGDRLLLAASVLQTQGKNLCPQPCTSDSSILCWNGDIFGGSLINDLRDNELGDTKVASKHLSESFIHGSSPADVLASIDGPYSFILYNKQNNSLWFGRDPAGRHSLLYGLTASPFSLTLSSVAHSSHIHMKELPALGLFEIDLRSIQNLNELCISLHPWEEMNADQLSEVCDSFPVEIAVRPPVSHQQYIFRPLLSFDCSPNEQDFINFPQALPVEQKMKYLSNLKTYHKNIPRLLSLIEDAVKVRVQANISLCQDCAPEKRFNSHTTCAHSKVAILFSGGLDSAILARLSDKYVPQNEPIDLLNVAFEKKKVYTNNRRKGKITCDHHSDSSANDEENIYNVPDRQSGRKGLKELQELCPNRQWNFVEINVPAAELQIERSNCIVHLIHPLKTILDDSLGCALWFAARGKGKLLQTNEIYKSPARIVVSGIGADEQFGGYMRHRSTLKNHGWDALHAQLQLELKRIPSRNLGRDDRVISHHGRQPRMPFLDENVIRFVKTLPPWERCWPSDQAPCGIGDKLLLRLVAWHIGLQGAAVLRKRAMQFGSRIANSKENAADTSDRL